MKHILAILLLILSLGLIAQEQSAHRFVGSKTITISADYKYLLSMPATDSETINGKYPLIVFLHGAGERGDSINLVKVHGPPKIVENNMEFPFMVLSPQCASNNRWNAEKLDILLDEIVNSHPVDINRIYLTGLSMGGFGTWDWIIHSPDRFAAIAPICGGARLNAFEANKFKHVPVWAFHGAMDNVVPIEATTRIVQALKQLDADVRYTIYPMAGHDSWTETYENPKLYEWFLNHSLNN